jgi:multiple sugar transport system ATP-binding protein
VPFLRHLIRPPWLQEFRYRADHFNRGASILADEIVVFKGGEVIQAGAPMDPYHEPANAFVAGFLGSPSMNFLEVEVREIRNGSTLVSGVALESLEVRARLDGLAPGASAHLGIRH